MATIKQIAEKAGVSSAAVSRVLNYDESISVNEETRQAIFAAAEELGYKKKIIKPKIENVALVYWVYQEEELEDIYFKTIYDTILEKAEERNVKLNIYTKKNGIEAVSGEVTAFIAIGWFSRRELDYLASVSANGIFIDTSPDEKRFDAVRPNLDSMVTQMVDYFVEKGHRTLGFIGGYDRNVDTQIQSMDVREWSFRESARYHQCLQEEHIHIVEKFSVKEGYRIGKEIVQQGHLPTAFCIASDTLAIGVLQAFNEAGVQIPEQTAVFSINDVNIAQYVSPPLTTFRIDVPLLCESALDLLQERVLRGRVTTKTVFVNGIPVFRKSC
jgi:LacI family transcriptional regulator